MSCNVKYKKLNYNVIARDAATILKQIKQNVKTKHNKCIQAKVTTNKTVNRIFPLTAVNAIQIIIN